MRPEDRVLRERLQTLCYSLFLGAMLTALAGWVGALMFPELALIVGFVAVLSLLGGEWQAALFMLVTPVYFGFFSGSWTVTLVALPLTAQALHHRPALLLVLAPVIGTLIGLATIAITARNAPQSLDAATTLRFHLAGGFAGFVVGAIFGRRLFAFLR